MNQLNIKLMDKYFQRYFDLDLDLQTSEFEYIRSLRRGIRFLSKISISCSQTFFSHKLQFVGSQTPLCEHNGDCRLQNPKSGGPFPAWFLAWWLASFVWRTGVKKNNRFPARRFQVHNDILRLALVQLQYIKLLFFCSWRMIVLVQSQYVCLGAIEAHSAFLKIKCSRLRRGDFRYTTIS